MPIRSTDENEQLHTGWIVFQSWRTPWLFDALVELSLYGTVSTLERFDELRFIFDIWMFFLLWCLMETGGSAYLIQQS